MLRWLLFALALALLVLGLLTVVMAPVWSPWQLAVLAGEFGHWFAAAAIGIGIAAWWGRGGAPRVARLALALCVAASVLLLKPAFQAWRIASSVREELAAQFGARLSTRAPFSFAELFLGRNPVPVAVQTLTVPGGLPLDFYRAAASGDGRPAPCVIVVHGGGWDSGDRRQIPQLNHWLARRGYSVAAISYRLAPTFIWPAQRDDVLAAIAFVTTRASELGIDPVRLVLLGRSAGGQIALATGYTAGNPAIRGVVGLYTPSDLSFGYVNTHENDMLKTPALMRQYLGGTPDSARAKYESASAYYHVSIRTPPTLLLHGENDALTLYQHSVRLNARLAENGVPRVFVSMPWATHAFDFNLHGPGGQLTTFALEWFLVGVTK